jgi:hypothetical protein
MREGRRVSQRRLFSCKTTLDKEAVPETQTQLHLNDLPEVLLIEVRPSPSPVVRSATALQRRSPLQTSARDVEGWPLLH